MTLALDLPPQPESALRALDPRWKLVSKAVAVVAVAVLQTLTATAAALVGPSILGGLGRVPARWYVGRLALLAPFLGLVVVVLPLFLPDAEPLFQLGPMYVSGLGLQLALRIVLKALAIVS